MREEAKIVESATPINYPIRIEQLELETELPATAKGQYYVVTDKKLRTSAIAVAVLLVISWGLQWSGYILPYWRGDEYHSGGLFQVCGTADFTYNPATQLIEPTFHHPWRCESLADYISSFKAIFVNHTESDWYKEIDGASKMIVISRWFEAGAIVMNMAFGATTLWTVVYPNTNEEVQRKHMYMAIWGILLGPMFCIVDSVLQFGYWQKLGVGFFNHNINTFFFYSGDVLWVTTMFDVILELRFLDWGLRREARLKKEAAQVAEEVVADVGDV
ncbi:UNVERIFIED_CONTAM: hypothetical protein HDU68_004171 [Siphonaria sp. JEL0065]|nr:hypothetical protein HDU68_004171 [Siphonaria sp. JEL0065]